MNRKGHIGTALVPLLALILVINALFVMDSFNGDISKVRAEIRATMNKVSVEHKFVKSTLNETIIKSIDLSKDKLANFGDSDFEKTFNESIKMLAEEKRASGLNTNVYAKIALGEYSLSFDSISGKYTLIVNDIFEQTNVANNEARYNYNLKVLFDMEKVISVESF